jgi:transposase
MMDEKGTVVKEGKIANSQGSLKAFLSNPDDHLEEVYAVLEAGRNWTVMYDWLEEEVDEVKLAHPLKVKAIAEAKIKTDKIDAKILAHLLRSDLIPEAYVPGTQTRQVKNILRQRMFFVKVQTMTKNRIHILLDRHPEIRGQIDPSDLFGKQGREWLKEATLPDQERKLLNQELELLEDLDERIKSSNQWITQLGKDDPRVKLLMTIPGIGKFFALLIATEIDDISRFRSKEKLCAYAGLIPSTFASGGKVFHGRLTHQGNKYLRWAVVEAVWPAIRTDLSLRMYYQKMKQRKGTNPAKVATARRLLVIIYRILTQNRPYQVNYTPGCPHINLAETTK